MQNGGERILQVDAFREAVRGDKQAARSFAEISHALAANIVRVFARDDFDFQILELRGEQRAKLLADVTRRREVAAENHGLKTSLQPIGERFASGFEFAVVLRAGKRFELAGEICELSLLRVAPRNLADGLARRDIEQKSIGRIVNGILLGVGVFSFRARSFQTIPQHLHPRRRAGHDAAQQTECSPVMNSLLTFRAGLSGDKLSREIQHLVKEHGVAVRKAVGQLPEELRTPLILSEYEELSHAEIGAILDCTPKAVETRIYRARKLLRENLGWLLKSYA